MFRKKSYINEREHVAESIVNRSDRKRAGFWSAALIPVFFLLLGWGIWSTYKNVMKPNSDYAIQTPGNFNNDGTTGRQLDPNNQNTETNMNTDSETGFQFGVGGAPVVLTPSPTSVPLQRNNPLPEEPPSAGFGFKQ